MISYFLVSSTWDIIKKNDIIILPLHLLSNTSNLIISFENVHTSTKYLKNDFSFLHRCTKCSWLVTNSRSFPRFSPVTGVCRPGRPGRLGANGRTAPTGNTSRRSKKRFSPVTCATPWRWWRTPTDEKFVEDFVDLSRDLDRRPSHSSQGWWWPLIRLPDTFVP